jgi:hypothetical protein
MAESTLTLTNDERACLVSLLETVLHDARIEEHRTRAPSFREHILQKEHLVESVLNKLKTS